MVNFIKQTGTQYSGEGQGKQNSEESSEKSTGEGASFAIEHKLKQEPNTEGKWLEFMCNSLISQFAGVATENQS